MHEVVWARDPWCRLCQGRRPVFLPDQMHEDPPRSQTRGLPKEQRWNLAVCCRLCHSCHEDVTRRRIRIRFLNPAEGFNGPIQGE